MKNLRDCPPCKSGHVYPSESDAMSNLWEKHCSHNMAKEPVTISYLKSAISAPDKLWSHQRKVCSLKALKQLRAHCLRIRRQQQIITEGVSQDGKFATSVYRIPKAVIITFSQIMLLVSYAAFTMKTSLQHANNSKLTKRLETFWGTDQLYRLRHLSDNVESLLLQVQHQLILMTSTESFSNETSYKAIGPETVATLLMSSLHSRLHASPSIDLIDIFSRYLVKLVRVDVSFCFMPSSAYILSRNTKSINTRANAYCKTSAVLSKRPP